MNHRHCYRLVLNAVKRGEATNWRQSDNPVMCSTWLFDLGDITVSLHDGGSVHVKPYPFDGSSCIGLRRRCNRILLALAKHGIRPTDKDDALAAWFRLDGATVPDLPVSP